MKKAVIYVVALLIGIVFAGTGVTQDKPEAAPAKSAVAGDTTAAPEKAKTKQTKPKKAKKKTTKKSAKKAKTQAKKPVEKPSEPAKAEEPAKN
jgi:hypothetical protein